MTLSQALLNPQRRISVQGPVHHHKVAVAAEVPFVLSSKTLFSVILPKSKAEKFYKHPAFAGIVR